MGIPLRGATTREPYYGPKLLHKALAVARFSPVMKISEPDGTFIGSFQEEIRHDYPEVEYHLEHMLHIEVADGDIRPMMQELPIWRFYDRSRAWRLSLTRESIAIDVDGADYVNWAHFGEAMARVVHGVSTHFRPSSLTRLGCRYINVRSDTENIRTVCNRDLVSVTGEPSLEQADLTWRFSADEGSVILRSGIMPPGFSYEPPLVDPSSDRSWYLDVDVFEAQEGAFDPTTIAVRLKSQVERAHEIYRWAVPNRASSTESENNA